MFRVMVEQMKKLKTKQVYRSIGGSGLKPWSRSGQGDGYYSWTVSGSKFPMVWSISETWSGAWSYSGIRSCFGSYSKSRP